MKSKKNLLEQLKSLPYFSKESLYQLGKQLGLADASVDTYISRFLKYKEIIKLKRACMCQLISSTKTEGIFPIHFIWQISCGHLRMSVRGQRFSTTT